MVSLLILGLAAMALVQFAIYQWRAIWISSATQRLSDSLHAATGLDPEAIGTDDFPALVEMYERVCPGQTNSTPWLREIAHYYWVLSRLQSLSSRIFPSVASWMASEMQICSRWVAVVIDQHLSVDMDRQTIRVGS